MVKKVQKKVTSASEKKNSVKDTSVASASEKKKNLPKATSVAASKSEPKKAGKTIMKAQKKLAAKPGQKKPTAKTAQKTPDTKSKQKKPAANTEQKKPAAKTEKKKPTAKTEQKKSAAKLSKKKIQKVKAAPAEKSAKTAKKTTPPPAASIAPKKAAGSTKKNPKKAASDVPDKANVATNPAVEKKETVPFEPISYEKFVFLETVKTLTSEVQKDIDSCSSIASTEQVKNEKLGLQIIKRSLKGVAVAKPEDGEEKDKILSSSKVGDKLAAGMVDIVFCCDTTSSMGTYLAQCKSTVNAIIKHILDKTQSEDISVKFGFVAYRDHPPQENTYLTCSYDLTTDDEIKQFIESLSAFGGGDYPEAVMDGLYVSAKHMSWRDNTIIPSLRYIFHITDAPPHGGEYSTNCFPIIGDSGCACEMDIDKISTLINQNQIHYRFICTDNMNQTKQMAKIFKEKMTNYEECSIKNAADMDIHISDMIIRELVPATVEKAQ